MGAFFDCFRGSNAEQNAQSNNIVTPDTVISKDVSILKCKT